MLRGALAAFLALALVGGTTGAAAQEPPDADLSNGIRQVDDGDYDAAILTLDTAAKRLAADPRRARELSQAYLYLGIAYVGKGQEAAARARFREALGQAKDLSLSPDKFPPKVINLFEAAKEEISRGAPAPAGSTAATHPPPPPKKGGGGKALLIVGGLVAVGGGVALAAGGGGSGASGGPTTTLDSRKTDMFPPASLAKGQTKGFTVVVGGSGILDADLTWVEGSTELTLQLEEKDPPYTDIAQSHRTSNTTATLSAAVTNKQYNIFVNNFSEINVSSFTLIVRHP